MNCSNSYKNLIKDIYMTHADHVYIIKIVFINDKEEVKNSSEQSDSIQKVTVGVEQISAVVQTNSDTAQESAAASEEISGQSQILEVLVSQFKVRRLK